MQVIDQRNFGLHGNVDPIRDAIEVVYFDRKRPLFYSPGNNIERFFDQLEAINQPETLIKQYEEIHIFLAEITDCLDSRTEAFFRQVIDDAYPGYEVRKHRVTRILPDHIVTGIMQGMR